MSKPILPLILLFLFAMCAAELNAATAIVTRTDDRNLTIANCPSTAGIHDCSLREAITFVNSNPGADTIQFQNPNMTIALTLGELNIGATLTIEGNNSTVRRASAAAFRILSVNADSLVTINGLTISNGFITSGGGGGIVLLGGSPSANLTLNNCAVIGNQNESGDGGGIFVSSSARLTLNAVTVSGNSALSANGGGIRNEGILDVNNSVINANSGGGSGGISNFLGSNLTMQNSRILNNQARAGIGAIANSGFASISGSTIDGNALTTETTSRLVSGIGNTGTMFLDGSTISRNRTIDGNDVGGMLNGGVMVVTNSTVSGNQNTAILNLGGLLSLANSTVSGNLAFAAAVESVAETNLRNTIIAGNLGVGNIDVSGNFTSLGNNLIGNVDGATGFGASGDIVGTNASPVDAHLLPLGLYGGTTETQPPLSNSPVINNGNNCVLIANGCGSNSALTLDQRGIGRSVGGTVDIGAAEFHLAPAGNLLADGTRSLPRALLTVNYSQQFEAVGGIYFFEVTGGALPPGMALGSPFGPIAPDAPLSTATLSGTPTAAGIYQFTITARNLANPDLNVSNNYKLLVLSPTAATVGIGGRVVTAEGRGISRARVTLMDASGGVRTALTSSFGYFRFDDVPVGETYVITVQSKRYQFSPQVVNLTDEDFSLNFTAGP